MGVMKKVFVLLALLGPCFSTEVLLETKAGYLYPTATKFRKIFSPGGGIYGLELSIQAYKNLYLWSSGSYFYKEGHTAGSHIRTEITLVPIPLGLKYLCKCAHGDFYLGAAGLTAYVRMRDHSPFVHQKTTTWGYGGQARIGYILNLKKGAFFSVFADYSWLYARAHHSSHPRVTSKNMNLSNVTGGISLGVRLGPSAR
jgi:outer membrane protein